MMRSVKIWMLAVVGFAGLCVSNTAFAGDSNSAQKLFTKYKDSVVEVLVNYGGLAVGFGSGFFVGNKGEFVTSRHVLSDYFSLDALDLSFRLSSGEILRAAEISKCGGEKNADICLLKLSYEPPIYFKGPESPAAQGAKLYVIGHPLGLDFSFGDGMVSGFRALENGVSVVQTTAKLDHGNSGGPMFDEEGRLIGISSFLAGGNIGFGIRAREVFKLLKNPMPFTDADSFRKQWESQVEKQAIERGYSLARDYSSLEKNPSGKLKGIEFLVDGNRYRGYVPDLKWKCTASVRSNSGMEVFLCKDAHVRYLFELKLSRSKSRTDYLRLSTLGPSDRCDWVKSWEAENRWNLAKKTLTENQRQALFTHQSDMSCGVLLRGGWIGLPYCHAKAMNVKYPGSQAFLALIQSGETLVELGAWTKDPHFAPALADLPQLFMDSLIKIDATAPFPALAH